MAGGEEQGKGALPARNLKALREANGGFSARKFHSMTYIKKKKSSGFFLDFYPLLPFLLPQMSFKQQPPLLELVSTPGNQKALLEKQVRQERADAMGRAGQLSASNGGGNSGTGAEG